MSGASYSYTLKADSGYKSSMSGRITPEQHAAISRILVSKDLGEQSGDAKKLVEMSALLSKFVNIMALASDYPDTSSEREALAGIAREARALLYTEQVSGPDLDSLEAGANQQDPQKIELTHYQIKALLEMSEASGDPECYDDLVLQVAGENAHSGAGLYAWFSECPEEGSTFIGRDADDQARGEAIAEERGHE